MQEAHAIKCTNLGYGLKKAGKKAPEERLLIFQLLKPMSATCLQLHLFPVYNDNVGEQSSSIPESTALHSQFIYVHNPSNIQ